MTTKRPPGSTTEDSRAGARSVRNFSRRMLAIARRGVVHEEVVLSVYDNGGLSGRYLIMTIISAAIAILGLMLGSPAVVIGAMLVSPMMGPIVALGFSLALLDMSEMRRALNGLLIGFAVALAVSILLTVASPLKEPTAEILARTRPNFFDLLIAIFSGVAGAYAVVRQRGETIIGVAIATALMPPVATVGFGIGTGDWRIAGGSLFLFMTNLVAIALAATVTAGYFGFKPTARLRQRPWRSLVVVVVFVLLSIPLALSLRSIGLESRANTETRLAVDKIFEGADSRVTSLDVLTQSDRLQISVLVSTRELVADAENRLKSRLNAALHVPVDVRLDQLVVANPQAATRALQASPSVNRDAGAALRARFVDAVPFAVDSVTVDADGRRAVILLTPESGLDTAGAYALESALRQKFEDVDVKVLPMLAALPPVALDDTRGLAVAVWALSRWRATPALSYCGIPAPDPTPVAEGETAPVSPRQALVARLAELKVPVSPDDGPTCQRGDSNLVRIRTG